MLVNENILRDVLREAIAEINKKSNNVEKTVKEMATKMFNFSGGDIIYILNGRTPVDIMPDDTMFKVTRILYEYFQNNQGDISIEKLDVKKYFNANEIKQYEKKFEINNVEKDIICDYWIPIANDEVVIKLSNKQILELVSSNRIHYNPETQRNLTVIETKNGEIKKVTIDDNAVESIHAEMSSGDYIPNALTFNVNPDISIQPKIVNGKYVIPGKAVLDCINGYHRLKASILTTKLNPSIEFNFIIIITGFDVKKSKKFIIQENYRVPLSEEQVTQDDQGNAANYIIDKLSQSMYFKNNISNIAYQLNRIINKVFEPERLKTSEEIKKALDLFREIEKNMNSLIEKNNWIGKSFTQEEWFVYLYLINYCINNNKNFLDTISKINVGSILEEIAITKEPIKKHFKIMNEVTKNV